MADLTKARRIKSGEIITMKGRLLYPALFKPSLPRGETDRSKVRYQATLAIPKAYDLKLLSEIVAETIKEKWGDGAATKHKIKKPFIKTEDQPRLAEFAEDYPVLIRSNSKDRPRVVYANLKECTDEADVYGGRWACLLINPYAYDHPTGGKGVSFGLQHVQILDNDEPMGGRRIRAEDAFEMVSEDTAEGAQKESADALFD
jgi:hypothetical protein